MSGVRNVSRFICHRHGLSTGESSRDRYEWRIFRQPFLHWLGLANNVCLLVELLELLVPVLEALASSNWGRIFGARGQLAENDDAGFRQHSGCPLLSQCWSKRLAHSMNLFTWALLSTRQLTALQTSSDGVHSHVQQCRALTSSSGGRESRCQLSWVSTKPVYCRFFCMGQSAGRLSRKSHTGSMPSINGVSVCFSASSGITSSPSMKLSRHGV